MDYNLASDPYSIESDRWRPSPVFLAILAVTLLSAWLCTTSYVPIGITVFVFVIAGWVLSLSLHEFAHAYIAWRSGDHSVQQRGYLTLDPLKYTNPLLSILLPVVFILMGGIGLPGGAVIINRAKLNDRQAVMVALAGPFTNFVFAALALSLVGFGLVSSYPDLTKALSLFGFLQAFVFVINMLPVPGLDGYAALEPLLPLSVQELLLPVRSWGFFILLILLFRDSFVRDFVFAAVAFIMGLFEGSHSATEYWQQGYYLMQFWRD